MGGKLWLSVRRVGGGSNGDGVDGGSGGEAFVETVAVCVASGVSLSTTVLGGVLAGVG